MWRNSDKRTDEAIDRRPEPKRVVVSGVQPFQFGLVGALGVMVALLIGSVLGQLSTVLVYIGLALFLSLGLDPIVSLIERKLPRPAAIAIVVGGVILAFAGIVLAIVPVLVEQATNLITDLPDMVKDAQASQWYHDLEAQYGSTIQDAFGSVLSFVQDPGNLATIGGGVVAVGAGVAGGLTVSRSCSS